MINSPPPPKPPIPPKPSIPPPPQKTGGIANSPLHPDKDKEFVYYRSGAFTVQELSFITGKSVAMLKKLLVGKQPVNPQDLPKSWRYSIMKVVEVKGEHDKTISKLEASLQKEREKVIKTEQRLESKYKLRVKRLLDQIDELENTTTADSDKLRDELLKNKIKTEKQITVQKQMANAQKRRELVEITEVESVFAYSFKIVDKFLSLLPDSFEKKGYINSDSIKDFIRTVNSVKNDLYNNLRIKDE